MKITNAASGTNVAEIADGIHRIATPVPANPSLPGGFSFNQYLIVDDAPLLFHTGPRKMFPLVREAIDSVIPASTLRYVAFSHFESDECGGLNEFLAVAPAAVPVCSQVAKMVSVDDYAEREALGLADGETLSLGRHTVRWLDTPHLPHGWETGYLFDETTRTLLCGDLFTQPGADHAPLTEGDILGPSEAMRAQMDYYAHAADSARLFAKLAATAPTTLAVMHGSAWRGDGAALLGRLSAAVRGVSSR